MLTISSRTKIAALIKENPASIDAIASINPHFKKLYNPILRKILASRVTIGEAAKIGKCSVEEFFEKLRPLGFLVNEPSMATTKEESEQRELTGIAFHRELDVRADIAEGKDPFRKIMEQLDSLKTGETLLLINSFEPVPLIRIVQDRGYSAKVVIREEDEVYTYITRATAETKPATEPRQTDGAFDEIAKRYAGKMRRVDVRQLPMPQPMMTILSALEELPETEALYVVHKKLPMFLLPELKERGFEYVHQPTTSGVDLIIYKG